MTGNRKGVDSSDVVVCVSDIGKCYQMYERPQDRLKQAVLPRVQQIARFVGFRREPRSYFREFWALRGVSFEVRSGDFFGIIGRNGAGKSTLLQIIAGTLTPTAGSVEVFGRVAALLELGSGFSPDFTGRENIYLNAALFGLSREETDAKFDEIAAFADIGEFIDQPVKNYSSGMYVRLGFAVAIHILPDLFLVDEVLAVGDEQFQRRCAEKFGDLQREGTTIVLVTHSMAQVRDLCDAALWLDKGTPRAIGDASSVVSAYLDEQDRLQASHEVVASVRVALHDGSGRDATDVPSGSELTAHVEADLVQPREHVTLHVELLDGRGVPILDGRSDVPVADGRVAARVRVPPVPLRSGEYVVRASLEAEGQHRPVSASTHFLVGGGGSPTALLAAELGFSPGPA